jgi:hypothetical protein
MLSNRMMAQWRSRSASVDGNTVARRIIRDAQPERERIAVYIRDAESALKSEVNPKEQHSRPNDNPSQPRRSLRGRTS